MSQSNMGLAVRARAWRDVEEERSRDMFHNDGNGDSTEEDKGKKETGTGRTRYLVASLLCVVNAICYADRTNIGIVVPLFLPGDGDRGVVLSAFFFGYTLTQVPAGFYWIPRFGAKRVLAAGVAVWTLCDVATVLVSGSVPLLVAVRAGMGCGEGVVMPCLLSFAASWFPREERTTLVAFVSSGSDLGTVLALLLSPSILKISDWRTIFFVFGFFSVVWLAFFLRNATSRPEQHPTISRRERDYILSARRSSAPPPPGISPASSGVGGGTPWRTLLTNRHLWVIYFAHFCSNYSWYILLGWLPTYIKDRLGLDLRENRLLAATPYVCGYAGLMAAGRASDALIGRGVRTLRVRRWMNTIGSATPALLLHLLRRAGTPAAAIAVLSGALLTGRASTSGFWINIVDVGPDHAGEVTGVSNAVATLSGILGNLATGAILQRTGGDWNLVFDVAALVSVAGGAVFALLSTDRDVFEADRRKSRKMRQRNNGKELTV